MRRLVWMVSMLFAVCSLVWSESFSLQQEFNLTEDKSVKIVFTQGLLSVSTEKLQLASQQYGEETRETLMLLLEAFPSIEPIVVDDYNSDGYYDFALCVAVGYGGLNTYRDYYFYDAEKKRYQRHLRHVSNLEKRGDMLFTSEKSSQIWYFSSYKFKEQIPYRFTEERQQMGFPRYVKEYDSSGKMRRAYWDPDRYIVAVPKLYLGKSLYIIEGDRVKLLDVDIEKNKAQISYKGKKRAYMAWVDFFKLLSEEEWMHMEMWSKKR